MIHPKGPGSPFELLFTADDAGQPSLPEPLRQIYPGDWHMPTFDDCPYVYSNFAISRDGRISFNAPGQASGEYITGADPHDRWLMGLLRARADAVLFGDGILRAEPEYLCTPASIYPPEAEAFAAFRAAQDKPPTPLMIVLSFTGDLPADAACLQGPDQHIVLATTRSGAERAQSLTCASPLDVLDLGEDAADLPRLMQILRHDYQIHHLLCEGGARVLAGLLDAGLVDEEFVTWCPTFVGSSPDAVRPSYTEGVAWMPGAAPYSQPISLHKAGDYLYLHTRCRYPNKRASTADE